MPLVENIPRMTLGQLIDAYAEIYCSPTADKGFSRSEKYKLSMLFFAIADRCNREGISPEGIVLSSLLIASAEATEYESPEISNFISVIRKVGFHQCKRWIANMTRRGESENA